MTHFYPHISRSHVVFLEPLAADMTGPGGLHFDDMLARCQVYRRNADTVEKRLCFKAVNSCDFIDTCIVCISCMSFVEKNDGGMAVRCIQAGNLFLLHLENKENNSHRGDNSEPTPYVECRFVYHARHAFSPFLFFYCSLYSMK